MSVPAEQLDILFKDLLEKTNQSSEEMNVIDLEEYKKANKNKIALLNLLKNIVISFNGLFKTLNDILSSIELLYLLCVVLKYYNKFNVDNEEISIFKNIIEKEQNDFINKTIAIINEIKNYPNKKLKATSLKLDNKTYTFFKYFKNRIEKIKFEIEEYAFSPPPYMDNALENLEHILKKANEYEDSPESFLKILSYYYADPEDLEWTDADREYVRKHYASKER
ncbi:MAG TPA: hypothetical protein DDW90_01860 [Cyanobacteria bacterium UBA9971]|nr:hypothetical protein [Cyanobacteria bacterium UBA9971]